MNDLLCPGCQNLFETISEPDFEYEKCPNCHGIFLDKNELNLLAIGHSGNIELNYINFDVLNSENKPKICPKCRTNMQEVRLGQFSFIYLDFCPNCNGYFLEQSEDKKVNDYLQSISLNKSNERFRGYVNNVLVRVDIENKSNSIVYNGRMLAKKYIAQNYLVISAFYNKPLDIDLLITQENFLFKALKLILGIHKNDLHYGNSEFDNLFKIYATDVIKVKIHLSDSIISKIIEFIKKSPKIYKIHGKLTLRDDRIEYREGPYTDDPIYLENEKFSSIFKNLSEIANKII
jgi:uncharacterized protein